MCFFQGIIPIDYIAGVVREGRFAGHLINNMTQLVFMDEWTNDSLSCEDAKRVLQGMQQLIFLFFFEDLCRLLFENSCFSVVF